MKVILIKQRRGLGKIGDTVIVKDGYGRNFLIPEGIAMRATAANEEIIASKKTELEKQNSESKKAAESMSSKIAGKDFTFIRQCADDGRLFGSVSAKDISQILSEKTGLEIYHSNVFLQHPIKSIGIHEVSVSLHADVSCNILVNVGRSESEAKDALNAFKADNSSKPSTSDNNADENAA